MTNVLKYINVPENIPQDKEFLEKVLKRISKTIEITKLLNKYEVRFNKDINTNTELKEQLAIILKTEHPLEVIPHHVIISKLLDFGKTPTDFGIHDTSYLLKSNYTQENTTEYLINLQNLAFSYSIQQPTSTEIELYASALKLNENEAKVLIYKDKLQTIFSKLYIEKLTKYINNLSPKEVENYYKRNIEKFLRERQKIQQQLKELANDITKDYLATPNHLYPTTLKKQKATIEEIKENSIKKQIGDFIISKTPEEKKQEVIHCLNNWKNLDISEHLGVLLTPREHLVIRALRYLTYKMYKEKKIQSLHEPITIYSTSIYNLCGLAKTGKHGSYHTEQTKEIQKILLKSNLTTDVLIKDDLKKNIRFTKLILEREFKYKNKKKWEITIKLCDLLFIPKGVGGNFYLQDVKGFARFLIINKSDIGFHLFLYLEKNNIKEVNCSTIIKELNLTTKYKKDKNKVTKDITKALNNMCTKKTLIINWKKEKGIHGQDKYIFERTRHKKKNQIQ